jgi:hypothetical protein
VRGFVYLGKAFPWHLAAAKTTGYTNLMEQGESTMSFDDFMTDSIEVLKQNGERIQGLKASVQSKGIILDNSSVLIEPRDLITRKMSNGGQETYEVIDPGFHEAFHGIEAHYQMKVRKLGLPEAQQRVQSITYNVTGSNARVNHHSTDNSVNYVALDAPLLQQVGELRKAVEVLEDQQQKSVALDLVAAVEQQLAAEKPSKPVITALLAGLPHVANIASIAASLITML